MKKNRKKRYIHRNRSLLVVNAFLVLFLFIGLGYSVLSTDLRIFGTIDVNKFRDGDKLYVKSDGSDSTGFGTIAKPYQSLNKAFYEADDTSIIYVMDNITATTTANLNGNKNITVTSCTKVDDTTCNTGSTNTVTRGNALTNQIINQTNGEITLQNIVIDGNNVEATTPMIYTTAKLDIKDGAVLTKAKNINDYGGAIGIDNSGEVTMTGGTISYNTSPSTGGGAIFLHEDTSNKFTMQDGLITHNISHDAGAIWNGGTVNISGGTISYNETNNSNGGAILIYEGILNISGGLIDNNRSSDNGGGIYNHGGTFIMNGGTISNNSAYISGGGVFSNNIFTLNDGTISNNSLDEGYGGGVYSSKIFNMNGGSISNNQSPRSGGGVVMTGENAVLTMTGGSISGNSVILGTDSSNGGGIHFNYSSKGYLNGGIISNNYAGHVGGGIGVFSEATVTLNGTSIKNNSSVSGYGSVHIYLGTYTRTSGIVCGGNPYNATYDVNGATCPS